MPITVDTLGEIKRDQTEYFCLPFLTFLERVVLSPSLYMLIQLCLTLKATIQLWIVAFRIFTSMLRMSVNILPLLTSILENNC